LNFSFIINQIFALFILMLIGYYLRKIDYFTDSFTKKLSDVLTDYILPALILSSLTVKVNATMLKNAGAISIYWFIFFIIVSIIAYLIGKFLHLSEKKIAVLEFLLIFGNIGYMGLPVLKAVYPEQGAFFGTMAIMPFNFSLWTYGIYLYNRGNGNTELNIKNLLNNGIYAIIIGLIFMLTDLQLPVSIKNAVTMLADSTFPLSMLIIGSTLATMKLSDIFKERYIIGVSLLRLIIIPLTAFYIFDFFVANKVIVTILTIQIGMPAAANAVIFAEKFDANYRYAAEGVFLTTLFSLITIPLLIYLIT